MSNKDPIVQLRNEIRGAFAKASKELNIKQKLPQSAYERYGALTNRIIDGEINIAQFEDQLYSLLAGSDLAYAAELARKTANKVGSTLYRYRNLGGKATELDEVRQKIKELEQKIDEVK